MTERKIKHWQDPVNVVLGLWFVASPWIVGYADRTPAVWSAVIAGLVLAAAAAGAALLPQAWEEWTEAVVGVWMIASPWLLSFADHRGAMSAAVVTGLIAVVLALWRLGTDREFGWWRERVSH